MPAQRRRRPPARYDRPGSSLTPYQRPGSLDYYGEGYRSTGAQHRAQAAVALRGAYKTGVVTVNVGRAAVRHRRRMAALYASTALAVAGELVHVVPGGIVAAGVVGSAPAAWGVIRRRAERRRARRDGVALAKPTSTQLAGWAARLGTAAWLPLVAAEGWADPLRLLLAAGSATGMAWWAIHTRPAEPAVLELSASVGDPEPGWIEQVWDAFVAGQGGPLPGSYLSDVVEDGEDWSATINLARGKQNTDTVRMQTRAIASAYGIDPSTINILDAPDRAYHQAVIKVFLDRHPLAPTQELTAPSLDPDTGWITAGNALDGGVALWRLFEPGSGLCGGLIFGAQGTGKSGFVNTLCVEITHSALAVLWIGDGQEGLSLPDWTEHGADYFAGGLHEVRRMLRAAKRVILGRQHRRKQVRWTDKLGYEHRGLGSFTPTRQCPGLFIVLDEWPMIAKDPECRSIVALIYKVGRKVGVMAIVIGQIPSVAEFGNDGDASVVRSLASTTNVAMFRVAPADKSSQNMGGMGLEGVDPTEIPTAFPDGSPTAGLGYLRAPGGSVLYMRALYPPNPIVFAASAPGTRLEPEAIEDAGQDYQTWRERREAGLDELPDPEPDDAAEDADEQPASLTRTAAPTRATRVGSVTPLPQYAQASPRAAALSVLRGTGQILSTRQLARHITALTGAEATVNAVTAALKRAAADGEVHQYPALPGEDRSARWQAADPTLEAVDA